MTYANPPVSYFIGMQSMRLIVNPTTSLIPNLPAFKLCELLQ